MKRFIQFCLVFFCIIGICGCTKTTKQEPVQYFTGEYRDEKLEKLIEDYEKNFSPLIVKSEAQAKELRVEIGECEEAIIYKLAPIREDRNEIEDYIDLYLPFSYQDGILTIDLSGIYTMQEADLYGFLIEMDLGDSMEYFYFRVEFSYEYAIHVGFNETTDDQDVLINYASSAISENGYGQIDILVQNNLDTNIVPIARDLAVNGITLHLFDNYLSGWVVEKNNSDTISINITSAELSEYNITAIHSISLSMELYTNEEMDTTANTDCLIYKCDQVELYNDGTKVQELSHSKINTEGFVEDNEVVVEAGAGLQNGTLLVYVYNHYTEPVRFLIDSLTVNNQEIDYSYDMKLVLSDSQYLDSAIPLSVYLDQVDDSEKLDISYSYSVVDQNGERIGSGIEDEQETIRDKLPVEVIEIIEAAKELYNREEVQDTILDVIPYMGKVGEMSQDKITQEYYYESLDFKKISEYYDHMNQYLTQKLIDSKYSREEYTEIPFMKEIDEKLYFHMLSVGGNIERTIYHEEYSQFSVLEYNEDLATVLMKAAYEQNGSGTDYNGVTIRLNLVKEDGKWKIDDYISYDEWKKMNVS